MARLALLPFCFGLLLAACSGGDGNPDPGAGGTGGTGGDPGGGGDFSGGQGGGATDGKSLDTGVAAGEPPPLSNPGDATCGLSYPQANTFFLSPDDSGSMASPTYTRELLRKGLLPAPERVRPYEFLNYYHFEYPEPVGRLQVHGELQDLGDGTWELLVAVRARSAPRPQVGMTFVVDTSASMAGPGMARARRAVTSLINSLAEGDVVSVVKWSSDAEPLVEGQVIHEATKPQFTQQVVELLAPYGGSDLTGGLQKGYQVAHDHLVVGGHNRVVLVSDGGASPSEWDLQQIEKEIAAADDTLKIHLTGIGVGPAEGYDDALMDRVTDAARGSYAYVDDDALADAILESRFDELMFVSDEAIGITLQLPGYFQIQSFSGEQIASDEDLVRDQHIAPGDTVLVRQTLVLEDKCDKSVFGSLAYAPTILATVSSGKGDAYSPIDTASIGLVTGTPSLNLVKVRVIQHFAEALQQPTAALVALAEVAAELDAAQEAFFKETSAYDEELSDLQSTLQAFANP